MRRTASVLKKLALADFIFASAGTVLYLTLLPYDVVLIDAIIWVIEALLFAGIIATLNVITSKTLYDARYELLRGESLASLFIAVVTIAIIIHLITDEIKAVLSNHDLQASHPFSTTYIFAGAVVSLLITYLEMVQEANASS